MMNHRFNSLSSIQLQENRSNILIFERVKSYYKYTKTEENSVKNRANSREVEKAKHLIDEKPVSNLFTGILL